MRSTFILLFFPFPPFKYHVSHKLLHLLHKTNKSKKQVELRESDKLAPGNFLLQLFLLLTTDFILNISSRKTDLSKIHFLIAWVLIQQLLLLQGS